MYKKYLIQPLLAVMLVLGFTGAAFADDGGWPLVDLTQPAGAYRVELKLLPAEPFVTQAEANKSGNKGKMVTDSKKVKPVAVNGDTHPNRHLVVFIKKDGKPVKDAQVKMTYERQDPEAKATELPVVPMWVAGVGKITTHYGNNVNLEPGDYVVHVSINGKATTDFKFTEKQI